MSDAPALLQEGDVIDIHEGYTVYADIPMHFVSSTYRGDFSLTHCAASVAGELSYLAGEYVVVKTIVHGGGTGHGPHDVYPDGHHVYCESVAGGRKIDFYQTGCFTAMIEDIKPHGRAVRSWVKEVSA